MNKPIIFDTSDGQQLRINMISSWQKKHYREFGLDKPAKIVKLSLDGGFTCPNRDGTKGTGGCLFCSENGSGDMASSTMEDQIRLLSDKWPADKYDRKYIAYFQSHTNTYAPAEILREKFENALANEDVIGLAIATRPDCISDEVLKLLDELNRKTFLWVELGLQTVNDNTAELMNLCHCRADYDSAAARLTDRGIRIVTHLILGLPGENEEDMLQSVKHACSEIKPGKRIFGLKLHMLNVVRGSGMEKAYPEYIPFRTMEEYVDLLIRTVETVPPEITIHRISGDAPRSILIAPDWSYRKRTILNRIHKKMKEMNTWQGRKV